MDDSPHPAASPPAPDCFHARLHLHAYVDGELEASSSIAVRHLVHAHVATCPRCARLERQLRAQRAMLQAHAARTAPRASDALRARVLKLLAG
jgi:anti-sigma factor RsiW